MCGPMSALAHLSVAERSECFAVKANDYRTVVSYRSGGHVTSPASPPVTEGLSVKFSIDS